MRRYVDKPRIEDICPHKSSWEPDTRAGFGLWCWGCAAVVGSVACPCAADVARMIATNEIGPAKDTTP